MSGFLADKEPAVGIEDLIREDDILDAQRFPADEKWSTLLRPAGMGSPAFMEDREEALPLDLNTLLKVLDQHNNTSEESDNSSWQLVVIQCLLLLALVFLSVCWACCCKKRCFHSAPPTVQAALRKLSSSSLKSRDFPPSYSQADLHTLAMSVHDYLYPPPDYPEVFRRSPDELAYLDLEAGHTRLAKLSFSGSSAVLQGLPGLSRQTSTLSSESRKSSLSSTGSRKNSIMKDPNSRRSSTSQDSRRSSRISFSEEVECSNGSVRRLSGHQDLSRKGSSSSLSSSSTSADTSRRSSLLLSRKLGLSQETLDKELRKKLESIEQEDGEVKEERREMERRDRKDSHNVNLDTVVEIEKY